MQNPTGDGITFEIVDLSKYCQTMLHTEAFSYTKILICGDRHYDNYLRIIEILQTLRENFHGIRVIEGGANGADSIAKYAALMLNAVHRGGFDSTTFEADWKKYGARAGPIRNSQMLKEQPVLVVAFHDAIEKSRGTRDTIKKALNQNIPTILVTKTQIWAAKNV